MKATELRIGNLLMFKETPIGGGVYPVMAIKDDLIVGSNGVAAYLNEIEPIPITDEWLERFGFNNSYSKEWWKGEILYNAGFVSKEVPAHGTYVQYVHQLQNLYFAFTGEELELK